MKEVKLAYIVEDDEIASFLVKRIVDSFSEVGESKTYFNGEAAFNILKFDFENSHTFPDLILLDINMPVMDGWDFLEALGEINPEASVPVYILTSSIDPSDMEKSRRYKHVKGFLSKPLTRLKFENAVMSIG